MAKNPAPDLVSEKRKRYFAQYLNLGVAPDLAAEKAGYPLNLATNPQFTQTLAEEVRSEGYLAEAEISAEEILAGEVIPNILHLKRLRDWGESESVQLSATMNLLALAGKNKENAVAIDHARELLRKELMSWTRAEKQAFMIDGAVPKRLSKAIAPPVADEAPPTEEEEPNGDHGPIPEPDGDEAADDTGFLAGQ